MRASRWSVTVAIGIAVMVAALQARQARAVQNGVYTEEQAEEGRDAYRRPRHRSGHETIDQDQSPGRESHIQEGTVGP
jgi:hypothetical protein